MLKLRACFWRNPEDLPNNVAPDHSYTLNHDDATERRTLGMRCKEAFDNGWAVATYPVPTEK